LLDVARGLGAEFVATGHHARVEKNGGGRYFLKKGADHNKDQTYVLYPLTQEQLRHTLLPVGELTKEQVREKARQLELPVAVKAESQEICFIPDDYSEFLKRYIPQAVKAGPILDRWGSFMGEHQGIPFYTIGQRKGLGISAGEPLYVTAIVQERNAIVVGGKDEVYATELTASGLNWISISMLERPIMAKAKIRYQHREAEAEIIPLNSDSARVRFKEPQLAITPGQAVVFYDEDAVIGGGTIE
jgi:tRNA-specific 2-thiouridylase